MHLTLFGNSLGIRGPLDCLPRCFSSCTVVVLRGVSTNDAGVRARVEARREATVRAAARRAEAAERAVRAANHDTTRLAAVPVRALQSGAAQLRM